MSVQWLPGMGFDSNIFLVTGDDPFLVDTGTGLNMSRVFNGLSKFVKINKIRRIVLTHGHMDHVGGAAGLKEKLSVEILIHELDAPMISDIDNWRAQEEMFGIEMEPFEVETFVEGVVFSSGENDFRVIHTPGHSSGSVCLFDDLNGSLISGDTVFSGSVGRWDLFTGSYGDLVGSIKKLAKLDAVDLYPGHGPCSYGDAGGQIVSALRYLGDA